jgi:hypothetical protein
MHATTERIQAYMAWVYLADHEYAGSTRQPDGTWKYQNDDETYIDNMRGAAQEVFDAHPDKEHLIVEVVEHGGWYLSFNRSMLTIGTANDMARFSDEGHAYRELLKGAEWHYLPTVRRGGRR